MGNTVANRCRPQMKIHTLTGKNLRISNERLLATRFEGYADAMFFGSRTVDREEQIELTIMRMTGDWNGSLRFGFTSHDPVAICNHPEGIPRFMCPDLIKRGGSFIETLNHIKLRVGDKIVFWVSNGGEIKFKVNEVMQRNQVTKLVTRDVWPVVDVYGNAVEVTFRSLKDKNIPTDSSEPHFYSALNLCKFPVAVNSDSVDVNRDAFRRKNPKKAYAWNAKPLNVNNVWILYVEEVDFSVSKDLPIAVLINAPVASKAALPESIDGFQRCTTFPNVYARMMKGDELAVCITDAGKIMVAVNGEAFESLGVVPKSSNYWIVADMNCDVLSMRSTGVYQMTKFPLPKLPHGSFTDTRSQSTPTMSTFPSRSSMIHTNSTDANAYRSLDSDANVAVPESTTVKPLNEEAECVICLNNVPNSVFVPCGHVCCCKPCADNLMNEHGNLYCPTCRKKIDSNHEIFF